MAHSVMVFGVGEVGGHILEFLARTSGIKKIIALDINEKNALAKLACVRYGAMFEGYYPEMELVVGDVFDVDNTSRILRKIKPDLIINTASLQSWWVITELHPSTFKRLHEARLGPWLPMHLAPTMNVMKAVKNSGVSTKVVSIPFPDAVNPVLDSINLAPTVGAGNVDELVPPLQYYVSKKYQVSPKAVQVCVIGHHYHNAAVLEDRKLDVPLYVKVMLDNKDITSQIPVEEALMEATKIYPGGKSDSSIIASSTLKNALAILKDSDLWTNAPGPSGLPGGYPVRLDASGAHIALPEGVTLEEAVSINKEAQKYDGIESIEKDGTVIFTDNSYLIMKEMLGYDCKSLSIKDVEEAAKNLKEAFNRLKNNM